MKNTRYIGEVLAIGEKNLEILNQFKSKLSEAIMHDQLSKYLKCNL